MTDFADVPAELLEHVRAVAMAMPDAYEEPAWTGVRWRVRKRTFAHVLTVDGAGGPATMVSFRAPAEELPWLLEAGHPFFRLGWGRDVVGMVLDERTDWDEVREVLTDSFCVMAPKKLAALVDRPA